MNNNFSIETKVNVAGECRVVETVYKGTLRTGEMRFEATWITSSDAPGTTEHLEAHSANQALKNHNDLVIIAVMHE